MMTEEQARAEAYRSRLRTLRMDCLILPFLVVLGYLTLVGELASALGVSLAQGTQAFGVLWLLGAILFADAVYATLRLYDAASGRVRREVFGA